MGSIMEVVSLTCFFYGVHLPPEHSVFVVVFRGIEVGVQTPFLLPGDTACAMVRTGRPRLASI